MTSLNRVVSVLLAMHLSLYSPVSKITSGYFIPLSSFYIYIECLLPKHFVAVGLLWDSNHSYDEDTLKVQGGKQQ